MRFIPKLAFVTLAALCFSCGSDKAPETAEAVANSETTTIDAAAHARIPPTQPLRLGACGERMKDFLRWYLNLTDYEKPHPDGSNFRLKWPITSDTDSASAASMKPENRSTTKFVQMDWPSVEKYLVTLDQSGYFSKSYLQQKHASLVQRGKALDAMKMEDGVPQGFEADEVFWTQELYEAPVIDNLRAYQGPGLAAGQAAYKLVMPGPPDSEEWAFLLYTKMEQGKCVIDSIAHLRGGQEHESLGNR